MVKRVVYFTVVICLVVSIALPASASMWASLYGNFYGQGGCSLVIYRDWNNGGVYMCYPTADTLLDRTVDYAYASGYHYLDGSFNTGTMTTMSNCQTVSTSGVSLNFYSGHPQYVLGSHFARKQYSRWIMVPPYYETYNDTLTLSTRWN